MIDDPTATVARDAAWLAHRYDPGADAVHFVHLPRDGHRRLTFLTDREIAAEAPPVVLRRADAVAAARTAAAPIHFVFHAAFCCSTLVARAFDREGWAMGLKEPVILNDLVGWRKRGGESARLRSVLGDALTLLARPFGAGEAVVVKPSNICNGLAIEMLAQRPDARALTMYAPLPEFLASIARKRLDGRLFARELFLGLLRDGLVRARFDQDQLFMQSDLQIAAMGWLAQIDLFAAMAARFGPDRVRAVDSAVLLAQPEAAMTAAAALFGLSEGPAHEAARGPAFTRHSKSGEAFDADARASAYAAGAALHAEEIEKVVAWTHAVAAQAGIPMAPPAPLVD